jgi:hypothetical protein
VFRLVALRSDDRFAFILSREGSELFRCTDPVDMAERMLQHGIENPLHLIEAAKQWGTVEIREARKPA